MNLLEILSAMQQIILLLHILTCLSLIALVVMQQGKGAEAGAAFGSGASQTVFGSRGAGTFLLKLTGSLAAVFFLTSLALNYLVSHSAKEDSVLKDLPIPTSSAPAPVHGENTSSNNAPVPLDEKQNGVGIPTDIFKEKAKS